MIYKKNSYNAISPKIFLEEQTNNNSKIKIAIEKNELIKCIYKNKGKGLINILGDEFVNWNRNKCYIIIDNKRVNLTSKIRANLQDIKIIVKIQENISDGSKMFEGCNNLVFTEEKKPTNPFFLECNRLNKIPEIKSYIRYIQIYNYSFNQCHQMEQKPDIKQLPDKFESNKNNEHNMKILFSVNDNNNLDISNEESMLSQSFDCDNNSKFDRNSLSEKYNEISKDMSSNKQISSEYNDFLDSKFTNQIIHTTDKGNNSISNVNYPQLIETYKTKKDDLSEFHLDGKKYEDSKIYNGMGSRFYTIIVPQDVLNIQGEPPPPCNRIYPFRPMDPNASNFALVEYPKFQLVYNKFRKLQKSKKIIIFFCYYHGMKIELLLVIFIIDDLFYIMGSGKIRIIDRINLLEGEIYSKRFLLMEENPLFYDLYQEYETHDNDSFIDNYDNYLNNILEEEEEEEEERNEIPNNINDLEVLDYELDRINPIQEEERNNPNVIFRQRNNNNIINNNDINDINLQSNPEEEEIFSNFSYHDEFYPDVPPNPHLFEEYLEEK